MSRGAHGVARNIKNCYLYSSHQASFLSEVYCYGKEQALGPDTHSE